MITILLIAISLIAISMITISMIAISILTMIHHSPTSLSIRLLEH